jgi:dTMP kinase
MNGRFITLEGPEGAGKSTLAKSLAERLQHQNIDVVITREPGDGDIGPKIREALLDGDSLDPWTELFLFLADRSQHVLTVIQPALEQGKWVVCDRFSDSTNVYQGHARGLPLPELYHLNNLATHGVHPHATLLLDLDPEAGLARLKDKNRLDREPLEFHQKVRKGFLAEAHRHPDRWHVLDASQPPDALLEQAWTALAGLLAARHQ